MTESKKDNAIFNLKASEKLHSLGAVNNEKNKVRLFR